MKKNYKRFLALVFAFVMSLSMTAFAQTSAEPVSEKDWVLISEDITFPSRNKEVRTYVYDAGNDTIITDVFTIVTSSDPLIMATTKDLSQTRTFTYQNKDITAITVKANFNYNNKDNVYVVSSSQTYTSPTNDYKIEKFSKSQGDYNGVATLFKAYVKVDYDVVNWNGSSINSGKVEITCDVNGKNNAEN